MITPSRDQCLLARPSGNRRYDRPMRVLLLEDDPDVRRSVAAFLRDAGFGVDEAAEIAAAELLAGVHDHDVLILDRLLPDGDAIGLVERRRSSGSDTPILLVTALDDVSDRVDGLREGADDYLVKPFAMDELVARVHALARRSSAGTEPLRTRLQLGDLELDPSRSEARRGGRPLTLTAKESALLQHLVENAGRVVSRSELIERCWDEQLEPMSNVVDVKIAQLRRKLGRPELIHTVRGTGYIAEARPA